MLFFVDKLGYIADRYESLCDEWRRRSYNVNQISREDLLQGIDKSFINGYSPTQEAIALNVNRINDRLEGMRQ